jgi:sirohydrochlorin ferrochelatase
MKALLIAAHGSRRQESNEEILGLARQIEAIAAGQFGAVRAAFLQFTAPSIHSQIDALVESGARSIVVFPFFISSGSHVRVDIPRLLQEARGRHPQIAFTITPHLGSLNGIKHLILQEVTRAA